MPEHPFLTEKGYTPKDKLVLLAAEVWQNRDPKFLADRLATPIASVRASLAKAGAVDPGAEASLLDAVKDALITVCGLDPASMRSKDWSQLAKVASELIEAGATPEEVRVRARNLSRRFDLPVTPGALDKYWAQLGSRSAYAPGRVLR